MPHPDAKTALALALRDALTTTPLSKVTVSGLTRAAGVTRQAFYYHFADIRDLTVWVFKREVADQILSHATYDDWSDGLLAMLVWMQSHPEETRSVISSLGMEELQIFLHKQLRAVMEPIVDQLGADLTVTEGDRIFITDHFTLAILGHISQWIATGMSADPYILTERIARILDGQVLRALTLFSEKPTAAPGRA
ncbi:TetR/AcrR family transcriptional regulator C-terminal domain-containing protein [uncultured Actinomyces sp.]|uniref:TetR/AcrR family transcriptional regulator n=1 Tax=uncultured Actinomyces sp. TaxID=249061 RepID=UPI0028E77FAE|nr:TetR/AcrR family transcriptional regulator C-terminal domain-containing protein [uncultured Actinomyces sp.]